MGKIVKVHNVNKDSTPLLINGRRVDVPHNIDFPLADNYVELLENSHINYTIIGDIADEESAGYVADEADESGPGGSILSSADPITGQVPGGDYLQHAEFDASKGLPIVTKAPEINQVPGGDNLTPMPPQDDLAQREAEGVKLAEDRRDAAENGTQEPVVVLRNDDPEQTGLTAEQLEEIRAAEEAKEAEPGPLDQSIPALAEHLDTITDAAEIDKLIAAETAGKSRSGALAALEARKEALAA